MLRLWKVIKQVIKSITLAPWLPGSPGGPGGPNEPGGPTGPFGPSGPRGPFRYLSQKPTL